MEERVRKVSLSGSSPRLVSEKRRFESCSSSTSRLPGHRSENGCTDGFGKPAPSKPPRLPGVHPKPPVHGPTGFHSCCPCPGTCSRGTRLARWHASGLRIDRFNVCNDWASAVRARVFAHMNDLFLCWDFPFGRACCSALQLCSPLPGFPPCRFTPSHTNNIPFYMVALSLVPSSFLPFTRSKTPTLHL